MSVFAQFSVGRSPSRRPAARRGAAHLRGPPLHRAVQGHHLQLQCQFLPLRHARARPRHGPRPRADARPQLAARLDRHARVGHGPISTAPRRPATSSSPTCLPPLSGCRHEGRYRLTFNLYEQIKDEKDMDRDPSESKLQCERSESFDWRMEVKSNEFVVFSAKKFPGLTESTVLSRTVAEQGCRVRIRRDVRMRRRENKSGRPVRRRGRVCPAAAAPRRPRSPTTTPRPLHEQRERPADPLQRRRRPAPPLQRLPGPRRPLVPRRPRPATLASGAPRQTAHYPPQPYSREQHHSHSSSVPPSPSYAAPSAPAPVGRRLSPAAAAAAVALLPGAAAVATRSRCPTRRRRRRPTLPSTGGRLPP